MEQILDAREKKQLSPDSGSAIEQLSPAPIAQDASLSQAVSALRQAANRELGHGHERMGMWRWALPR